MQIGVFADADAVAARGRFSMAVSGGHTPWAMLRVLAHEDVPWSRVQIFRVDERAAPAQVHSMPVEAADLEAAALRYA